MSLKSFHIVFIAASIALCMVVGAWAVSNYRETGGLVHLGWAAGSGVTALALAIYGVVFLRKLKHISYL